MSDGPLDRQQFPREFEFLTSNQLRDHFGSHVDVVNWGTGPRTDRHRQPSHRQPRGSQLSRPISKRGPDAVESTGDPRWHEDRALISRFLAGDDKARDAVLVRLECVPRILKSLNRRLEVPLQLSDLDDAAQETLITVWNRLPDFAGRAQLESWVYRFCFLTLMNHMRRSRKRRDSERSLVESTLPGVESRAEQGLLECEAVEFGFNQLGPEEADAVRLRYYEELSFREMAERLGVSPNTAKSHLRRGLDRFRSLLKSRTPGEKE